MANSDYTVTSQRQTTALGPDGRFTDVMEVSFRVTGTGITGQVDVPLYEYGPDRVHDLIAERVAAIKAVQSL